MENDCILCSRYVELVKEVDVWKLIHTSDENEGLVCSHCIQQKLNSGNPVGSCLYCEEEIDYQLQQMGVDVSSSGPIVFTKSQTKPMICEDHFEELKEDDKDHTLDIEKVLEDEKATGKPEEPVPEVIGDEESKYLEYKETFLYDVYQDQPNAELKSEVAKEVCALGNSWGGVVIIGVDDEKEIQGLERDYKLMGDERDSFELQLNQVISDKLGETFGSRYVTLEFHEIDGEDVCAVHVEQSSQPIYFEDDDFYIRDGSSSRPLDMREAIGYIHDHWEMS